MPTNFPLPSADKIPTNECRTLTSPEHQIPAMASCPPAPKKPRRTEHCKRKLQFSDIVGTEEMKRRR
ncbi:hypothetical protein ACSBR1_040366 [Camellia fascicularis]